MDFDREYLINILLDIGDTLRYTERELNNYNTNHLRRILLNFILHRSHLCEKYLWMEPLLINTTIGTVLKD
jgi:hypothetical protein